MLFDNNYSIIFISDSYDDYDVILKKVPFAKIIIISNDKLKTLKGIDVLFVQNDLVKRYFDKIYFPPNTKVISHAHSLGFSDDQNIIQYLALISNIDFYIVYYKPTLNFLKNQNTLKGEKESLIVKWPKNLTNRDTRYFGFLPCGYPRLENYMNFIDSEVKRDSILVMIHALYLDRSYEFVKKYLLEVIKVLCKNFKNDNILLCPNPNDVDKKIYKDICKNLNRYENMFYVDDTPLKNLYLKGKLLITDGSGVANSFALSQTKPRINCFFVSSGDKKTFLDDLGYNTYDMKEFKKAIRNFKFEENSWSKDIKPYRARILVKDGSFTKYIFDNIEKIIKKDKITDCIYIERNQSGDINEYYKKVWDIYYEFSKHNKKSKKQFLNKVIKNLYPNDLKFNIEYLNTYFYDVSHHKKFVNVRILKSMMIVYRKNKNCSNVYKNIKDIKFNTWLKIFYNSLAHLIKPI